MVSFVAFRPLHEAKVTLIFLCCRALVFLLGSSWRCLAPILALSCPQVTEACLERAPRAPRYSFKKAPRRPGDSLKRHQRAFRIVKYEVKCTSLQDGPAMLSYTCVQSCQFSSHFCTCARTLAVPVLAPRWPQDSNHIISNHK